LVWILLRHSLSPPLRPPHLSVVAKLSWSFKLYAENILRKGVRARQRFANKLCEELKLCEKLIDLQKKPIAPDAPFW
jgi:hypothetical protein